MQARTRKGSPEVRIAETERLTLRQLEAADAAFILELVNDPSWLRFIGNKQVHTRDDARRYIAERAAAMYERFGFGLWLVELKDGRVPIGMCGLVKRDTLDDVDMGFAFLAAHRGNGYAFEAASAAASFGWDTLGLGRIVAIVSPDNEDSVRLLERLGFRFERMLRLAADAHDVRLYAARRAREGSRIDEAERTA